jgi:hypothetical protein
MSKSKVQKGLVFCSVIPAQAGIQNGLVVLRFIVDFGLEAKELSL